MNERIGQRRGNPEGKRRNRQSLCQGNGSVTVFFACMQRSLFGKRSNPDVGNATCCVSGIFAGHDLARFDSISTGSRTGEGNRGPGSGFSAFLKQVFRPKIFFVKKEHFLMDVSGHTQTDRLTTAIRHFSKLYWALIIPEYSCCKQLPFIGVSRTDILFVIKIHKLI